MRRAVLLYNPNAGRHPQKRQRIIAHVAETLRANGIAAEAVPTQGPGTAGKQAHEAAAAGADIVFACGGDGTLHEVLQGLVHQHNTSLGIIPIGTANALARHIGLSLDPIQAALQQVSFIPTPIPLGHITYQLEGSTRGRYFTVLAGAGPDGTLIYRMLAGGKQRLGRFAYYTHALHAFLTTTHPAFSVTTTTADGATQTRPATAAMASRVRDLGGLFKPLTGGASITDPHLRLTLVEPPFFLSLPLWFGLGWLRLHRHNRYLHTLTVQSFTCNHIGDAPLPVQADGEFLGHTPMTVTLVPNALRLLLPPSAPSA